MVGGVILQKGLGTNTLSAGHTSPSATSVSPEKYTSSLRILWIFYTAVCVVMLLASLLIIQKAPPTTQKEGGDDVESTPPDVSQVISSKVISSEKV